MPAAPPDLKPLAPSPAPAAEQKAGPATGEPTTPPKVPVTGETLRQAARVFLYLKPYRAKFLLALGFLMIGSTLGLAFPYLIGKMLDGARSSAEAGAWRINQAAVLLMTALGGQALFSFFSSLWFAQCGQRGLFDLRCDVYGRLVTLPMAFFSARRVGELSSRISADLSQMEEALVFSAPQFLRQSILLLGACVLVAATSWRLALVMLGSLPVIILAAIFIGRKIRRYSKGAQDRLAESGTVVEETLQGIANVKAFVNESYERRRYADALGGFLDLTLKGARFRAMLVAFIIFALFGSIVLVMWAGAKFLQSGAISFGQLSSFVIYSVFVGGAVASFADLWSQIQKTVGATARVRELMDEMPEDVLPAQEAARVPLLARAAPTPPTWRPEETAPPPVRGEVRFEDVGFAYPARPDTPVLRGLSLVAKAGERVALVGPSGAGKSTVAALLLRFYDPQEGQVLIDGHPAAAYPLRQLRGAMALVPQEVLLFGGSIAENIGYGRPGATRAQVEEAARQANAHEFIARLPEGYDTVVGERGMRLSGGQRQRVAIARAILRDPAILVLDEATSSLDSESEALVQEALEKLLQGRTSVIIAHRLSTVRKADRIYVLEEGRVRESGTHEELVRREDGLYRRLSAIQFDLASG